MLSFAASKYRLRSTQRNKKQTERQKKYTKVWQRKKKNVVLQAITD